MLESALEHTLSLMRKVSMDARPACRYVFKLTINPVQSDARLAQEQPKTSAATWLPYTLIDQLLMAAESQPGLSARGQALSKELRGTIMNRINRVQQYSHAAR